MNSNRRGVPLVTEEHVKEMIALFTAEKDKGEQVMEFARAYKCSPDTIRRKLKEAGVYPIDPKFQEAGRRAAQVRAELKAKREEEERRKIEERRRIAREKRAARARRAEVSVVPEAATIDAPRPVPELGIGMNATKAIRLRLAAALHFMAAGDTDEARAAVETALRMTY